MKQLLRTNIKRSFKIIAEENPRIPAELIGVANDQIVPSKSLNIIEEMMKVAAQPVPWFYRDHHAIESPQQAFFGFYALRNIIRAIFLSVRFIQAGDLLYRNHFMASSVFSYYTASFHLLHAFLASHGRVIVDQVHGGPVKTLNRQYSPLHPDTEVIVAILTTKNIWKFEKRSRSHSKRWEELIPVFRELSFEVPVFLRTFLKYIFQDNYPPLPAEIEKTLRVGLERLTYVRHESIYSGYGFDDYVHDGLINRELDTSYGIDFKSKAYRDLSLGFLVHALNDAFDMKHTIDPQHWTKERILMVGSVNTPPFELFSLRLKDRDEINERLNTLFVWLREGRTADNKPPQRNRPKKRAPAELSVRHQKQN